MAGASRSLADKPGRPSLLSWGMFAEARHTYTEAAGSTAIAAVPSQARRGSRHQAAVRASSPVTAAVRAMWAWLNTWPADAAAAPPRTRPAARHLAARCLPGRRCPGRAGRGRSCGFPAEQGGPLAVLVQAVEQRAG